MTPNDQALTTDEILLELSQAVAAYLSDPTSATLCRLTTAASTNPLMAAALGSRYQRHGENAAAYQLYLAAQPHWQRQHGTALYNNLSVIALKAYDFDQAWTWTRHALAINPRDGARMAYDLARTAIFSARHDIYWAAARAADDLEPSNIRYWSALYVEDNFRRMPDNADRQMGYGPPPLPPRAPRPSRPASDSPRKLLLVGRDFSNTASFNRMFGTFRRLPDCDFQVECLSVRDDFDPNRTHLPEFTHHSTPERNIPELAAAIRRIGPDVIIDLVSHGQPEAFAVFAGRPAPLILGWAGNGVSSGTKVYDAFLTDPVISPPGAEIHYTERLIRLPASSLTIEPYPSYPEAGDRRLPMERNGHVTFGMYHRISKVSEPVIALWSDLLRAVPDSRLVIKTAFVTEPPHATRLLAAFAAHGIPETRLRLMNMTGPAEHCQVVSDTDITLTPFPEQGFVTDFDHLWMGVPFVAYEVDQRPCARLAATLARAAGAPFLVAKSPAAYIQTAKDLAADPAYLRTARHCYRQNLIDAGLTDHMRTARAMADAIRSLWQELRTAAD
ncbi:hypothetical protein ACFOGJ_08450 [Marinibaculum pumilum]|uniref:O-GlcNAc transferase C-terminal domain-containing protein n=1 Tax=Marinibaculum pumilum TaxID=1766165 RepID=A0ABV7KY48_9PROT